jgi:hypothetical protein
MVVSARGLISCLNQRPFMAEFRGPHLSTRATPDGNRTVFQFVECWYCFVEEPNRKAQTAR